MRTVEGLVLSAIGRSIKDLKSLCFFLEMPKEKIKRSLEFCEKQKLIKIGQEGISLTPSGLFQASQFSIVSDYLDIRCESNTGKPYFRYQNSLKRDAIFLPYMSFDEIKNIVGDYRYRIYRAEIKRENVGGLEVLKAIENCMSWWGLGSQGGFWILKSNRDSLYGFGVGSLEKALNDVRNPDAEIKVAFSESPYIVTITANIKSGFITKLFLRFYLSNCGETPYADTLKFLEGRLRVFLTFIGEKEIPRGEEVIIESLRFKKSDFVNKDGFIPNAIGKYFFKDKDGASVKIEAMPLIVVIPSDDFREMSYLGKLSPWFVTCKGGFLAEDFVEKRRFTFWNIENYVLDDVVIFSLMLCPWSEIDSSIDISASPALSRFIL